MSACFNTLSTCTSAIGNCGRRGSFLMLPQRHACTPGNSQHAWQAPVQCSHRTRSRGHIMSLPPHKWCILDTAQGPQAVRGSSLSVTPDQGNTTMIHTPDQGDSHTFLLHMPYREGGLLVIIPHDIMVVTWCCSGIGRSSHTPSSTQDSSWRHPSTRIWGALLSHSAHFTITRVTLRSENATRSATHKKMLHQHL